MLNDIAGNRQISRTERVAMVRRLIERRPVGQAGLDEALSLAALEPGDDEAVLIMLEVGADPHGPDHLLASPCFGYMRRHRPGIEAVIDALIAAGLDPDDEDENGFRPLFTALGPDTFGPGYQESDGYNRPAALALIRHGVTVNLRYPATDTPPLHGDPVVGYTPLHLAAQAGDGPVVAALLDAGADPDARTPDGRTALDLASAALAARTSTDADRLG